MPVSDATNPEEAAITAAAPTASISRLPRIRSKKERLESNELEQQLRAQCGCSSCVQWREAL